MAEERRADPAAEVASGFLTQASAAVYRGAVLEICFLVAIAPGLAYLVLLTADGARNGLLGPALVPLAPALAALLSGWRQTTGEGDLHPARHFWVAYRADLAATLRWWLPAVAVLTVAMINLGQLPAIASGGVLTALRAGTIAVVLVIAVGSAYAVVITTTFTVRSRDLPRLVGRAGMAPGPTVGVLAVIICVLGLAAVSNLLPILAALPAMLLLHQVTRPVITDFEESFAR